MILPVLAGAGLGAGLLVLGAGLWPRPLPLAVALEGGPMARSPWRPWTRPGARRRAEAERRAFAHAFGAFLDVVALALAAGRGIEGAVLAGAGAGRGPHFERLRAALDAARYRGETPWQGLDALGAALGATEVRELAATVALAGEAGARVRASVVAKARSLRAREMARAEAAAIAATVRMSLPTALLLGGFVVFVGYPPLATLLGGTP